MRGGVYFLDSSTQGVSKSLMFQPGRSDNQKSQQWYRNCKALESKSTQSDQSLIDHSHLDCVLLDVSLTTQAKSCLVIGTLMGNALWNYDLEQVGWATFPAPKNDNNICIY